MVRRFNNMYGIKKILAVNLDGRRGIRSKNKDRVTVITGYEGNGKSNLLLCMFEEWCRLIEHDIKPKDIVHIGDNSKTFIQALSASTRYKMVTHDEAGKDLYSRDAMSSFSKDLNKAYQVIRGRNLHTILVIPSILDLESFFRKRRVTQMFHVYAPGKVAYFSKKRLRTLIPRLKEAAKRDDDPDPSQMGVTPMFTDSFPIYEGTLKEAYESRKSDNMQEVIDELEEKYVSQKIAQANKPVYLREDFQTKVLKYRKDGLSWRDVAKKAESNVNTVRKAYAVIKG